MIKNSRPEPAPSPDSNSLTHGAPILFRGGPKANPVDGDAIPREIAPALWVRSGPDGQGTDRQPETEEKPDRDDREVVSEPPAATAGNGRSRASWTLWGLGVTMASGAGAGGVLLLAENAAFAGPVGSVATVYIAAITTHRWIKER